VVLKEVIGGHCSMPYVSKIVRLRRGQYPEVLEKPEIALCLRGGESEREAC
jgi:hypothetical protein